MAFWVPAGLPAAARLTALACMFRSVYASQCSASRRLPAAVRALLLMDVPWALTPGACLHPPRALHSFLVPMKTGPQAGWRQADKLAWARLPTPTACPPARKETKERSLPAHPAPAAAGATASQLSVWCMPPMRSSRSSSGWRRAAGRAPRPQWQPTYRCRLCVCVSDCPGTACAGLMTCWCAGDGWKESYSSCSSRWGRVEGCPPLYLPCQPLQHGLSLQAT